MDWTEDNRSMKKSTANHRRMCLLLMTKQLLFLQDCNVFAVAKSRSEVPIITVILRSNYLSLRLNNILAHRMIWCVSAAISASIDILNENNVWHRCSILLGCKCGRKVFSIVVGWKEKEVVCVGANWNSLVATNNNAIKMSIPITY